VVREVPTKYSGDFPVVSKTLEAPESREAPVLPFTHPSPCHLIQDRRRSLFPGRNWKKSYTLPFYKSFIVKFGVKDLCRTQKQKKSSDISAN